MTADDRHLTPDQVAGYLAGCQAQSERAEVARHLDACAECRNELVEVGGIVADYQAVLPRPVAGLFRRRLMPVAVVLAAGLAAIAVYRGRPRVEAPVLRAADSPGADEGVAAIEIVAPPDGASIADSVVLWWHSAGQHSYAVFFLSEDGRPLWTTKTMDTVVRLPSTVVLLPGATYFWRVDAMGNGIVASTGVRRLTVPR